MPPIFALPIFDLSAAPVSLVSGCEVMVEEQVEGGLERCTVCLTQPRQGLTSVQNIVKERLMLVGLRREGYMPIFESK